ncbi:MAG TPA: MOSC domain-containing protein [Candidatus Sulfotelmatobacter sp.]|nr:MOSC domain-containing protein [Candidatus Sulfotelmatobacter sp.]
MQSAKVGHPESEHKVPFDFAQGRLSTAQGVRLAPLGMTEWLKEKTMWAGTVESIHVASDAKAPTRALDQAQAIPGVGLEGDRYALKLGTFFKPAPDFELTLIEGEALDALKRDYEIELAPGEARRNVVTRGVSLNHLVGREFRIGDVRIRGIRLCEPCSHLQALVGRPVIKGLRHRGGLRAQILSAGNIHVGDAVNE